jgi:hypothetical protein
VAASTACMIVLGGASALGALRSPPRASSADHGAHHRPGNPCLSLLNAPTKVCANDLPNRLLGAVRPDGTLPKSAVLEAFAAAIAPLPGVRVPSGQAGAVEDGTSIIGNVLRLLPSLPRRQQVAARRAIYAAAGGRAAVLRAARRQHAKAAAAGESDLQILQRLVPAYESALGVPFRLRLLVRRSLGVPLSKLLRVAAYAQPFTADGKLTGGPPGICMITILLGGQLEQGQALVHILAHELFHCFQFQLAGIAGFQRLGSSGWLIEGGAEWAACAVAPSDAGAGFIADYVSTPGASLFQRTYDAAGFFDHLGDAGLKPFLTMRGMLESGGGVVRPGSDANDGLFAMAVGEPGSQAEADVLGSWASGLFQQPDRGKAWTANLPCNGSYSTAATPKKVSIANGQTVTIANGRAAMSQRLMSVTAGAVQVKVSGGYVRVSGSAQSVGGSHVDDVLGGQNPEKTYCTSTGGSCCLPAGASPPTGQLDPGPTMPELALTGSSSGGSVTLTGVATVCPYITKGSFTVSGAHFHADIHNGTWDAMLQWDVGWNAGILPLVAGSFEYATPATTQGGGTYSGNQNGLQCNGSLSLTSPDNPKDPQIKVLSTTGTGANRTWTVQVRASGDGYFANQSDCVPPPFGAYNPETLWQGIVTLNATGSDIVKTQTFAVASDPSHSSYENWTGTVTLTGVW